MAEMVSTVRHSGAGGKRDGHSSKQDAQRKQKKKGGAVLRGEGVDSSVIIGRILILKQGL